MLYQLSYLALLTCTRAGTSSFLAEPTGFEPATFCVTGRYANPYTTAPQSFGAPKGKRHDTEEFTALSTRVEKDIEDDGEEHHAADVEIAVKRAQGATEVWATRQLLPPPQNPRDDDEP